MKQRSALARIALLALLALFQGGPVIFSLDPWDAFPDGGDTALFILWAAALCLGAALLLAGRGLRLFRRSDICAIRTLLLLGFATRPGVPPPRCPFRSLTPLRI